MYYAQKQFVLISSLARAAALTLTAVTIGGAASADAQSVYVGAGVLADIKRFSGNTENNIFDGKAPGLGLTLGTHLTNRWGLELGVDTPVGTTEFESRTLQVGRSSIAVESRTRNRILAVSALVRLRSAPHGRLQFGYLAGLNVARLRREFDTVAPDNTPSSLIPRAVETLDYAMAPRLGVDADIAVTKHLSVVPALHVSVFDFQDVNVVTLRPKIGVRWTF